LIEAFKDPEVNLYAAEGLGKLNDSRAIEPLILVLDEDYSRVRIIAADALKKLGWQAP
jgi:HEAT repeat protein